MFYNCSKIYKKYIHDIQYYYKYKINRHTTQTKYYKLLFWMQLITQVFRTILPFKNDHQWESQRLKSVLVYLLYLFNDKISQLANALATTSANPAQKLKLVSIPVCNRRDGTGGAQVERSVQYMAGHSLHLLLHLLLLSFSACYLPTPSLKCRIRSQPVSSSHVCFYSFCFIFNKTT